MKKAEVPLVLAIFVIALIGLIVCFVVIIPIYNRVGIVGQQGLMPEEDCKKDKFPVYYADGEYLTCAACLGGCDMYNNRNEGGGEDVCNSLKDGACGYKFSCEWQDDECLEIESAESEEAEQVSQTAIVSIGTGDIKTLPGKTISSPNAKYVAKFVFGQSNGQVDYKSFDMLITGPGLVDDGCTINFKLGVKSGTCADVIKVTIMEAPTEDKQTVEFAITEI